MQTTISLAAGSRESRAGLSDVELLRRAVSYSRPCGFEVVEKWRVVVSLFGVGETVARNLCKRFHVDSDGPAAR
jgi:hypothetical protein